MCDALHIQWIKVFEWDPHNLKKIKAHRVDPDEVEKALRAVTV